MASVVAVIVVVAVVTVAVLGVGMVRRWTGADFSEAGVQVTHYEVASRHVGQTLTETAMVPGGSGAGRPLLLLLHGRGGQGSDWVNPELLSALSDLGDAAPVVVGVSGGDHSYFHDRWAGDSNGDWDKYVVDEVIPDAVRRFGVDSRRVAVGGHSMGGFGAFALALHHPHRFCAAGGHEPAIWETGAETAPGAFDDAADFARNDLVGAARTRHRPFGDTRLWLDRGDADDFIPGDEAFVAALRAGGSRIETRVWPGDHGMDYLLPHLDVPLRFYSRVLAAC